MARVGIGPVEPAAVGVVIQTGPALCRSALVRWANASDNQDHVLLPGIHDGYLSVCVSV